ncbi:dihydrodipicolinate synthetase [Neobacillus bataviensis LMG 21833]|uniref:Dihydrodipicolinate synthetase n=1 Tax=Neobacillus bataviensis LMG 21833 TaxID=1117379 RepID=K6DBN0_9BACI|nr:dihydrodipicolinate synthase family protein [Neobacillus bataviensis]EKN69952.1 dihydrodipicolinate synthetase [Neobacillus bataviensis LMG 21833]
MAHFIEGLVTEIIVSFNDDGSVDYGTTGDLIDFQIKNGVKNFFVNGLGGESHELTFEEQVEIVKTVADRCKGLAKIMACVFVSTVGDGKKLIDMYKGTDIDCLCLTAPPLFPYTDDALYSFTSELINYTDIPCYIYNCVQMGTLYSPETLEKLVKNHKNLYGYKDATRDIVHLMQCMMRIDCEKFDFLGGCDATIAANMILGCCGTVSFMGVPFPKETKEICDYALAGESGKAMEAQFKILKVRNVLKMAPFNAAYMYAQKFTGGPLAKNSRMPVEMLDVKEEVKKKIEKVMEEVGIK